jgi:ATP-dependent Clp protease ATP-binding subunit ClpC
MAGRAFSQDPDDDEKGMDSSFVEGSTKVLEHFGRDLTLLAAKGELDPVIGREEEIDMMVQILNKRKKNNPIIVGEAGTGKTALVEGLALRIVNRKTDRWLLNKRIIELNLSSLVGGTKYRGQFEERMKAIIDEAVNNDNIIIFIDEIHNVIGAGGASGSMDASQIIKPELARGTMRVIGATTLDEHKKTIANDSALDRRFQKVPLSVPSAEQTIQILQQIKERYEDFHGVSFSDETLEFIVELADRYINYRNFPDKAIDVLDEVGSKAKLGFREIPKELKDAEESLLEIDASKKKAVAKQQYEAAAKLRDKERSTKQEIQEMTEKWKQSLKEDKQPITKEDVAAIIASHTGIPVSKLTDDESNKLLKMQTYLSDRVIGQKQAIEKICEAVQRSRVGIQDPNKPIASLLFLGSTGVGKTYLSKILAEYMFELPESFIRFDMSEYQEKFQVTKLIGSPPGYAGHEEKGMLTEKVKNHPYSILLFDEVEKAHKDIFNIMLQILDEGKLTDNHGQEVNFKNTVIIMTSNLGTEKLFKNKALGFSSKGDENQEIQDIIMEDVGKFFRPELINRIDEKIIFLPLTKEEIMQIVELELQVVVSRIEQRGYTVKISDAVKEFLVEAGYDKKYGARPLKRAITANLENTFAQAVLRGELKEGAKITFAYREKDKKVYIQNRKTDAKDKAE